MMQATGTRIDIGNSDESVYLTPEQILCVKADGNYCDVFLADGDVMKTLSQQRAQLARKLDAYLPLPEKMKFALVGRSYIVNLDYVMRIQPNMQQLTFNVNEFGKCEKKCIHASVKALKSLIFQIELYESIKDYDADVVEKAIRELEAEKQGVLPIREKGTGAGGPIIGIPRGIDGSTIKPVDYSSLDDDSSQLIGVHVDGEKLMEKIFSQMHFF